MRDILFSKNKIYASKHIFRKNQPHQPQPTPEPKLEEKFEQLKIEPDPVIVKPKQPRKMKGGELLHKLDFMSTPKTPLENAKKTKKKNEELNFITFTI
jgi:hypothetical protein